MRLRLAAVAASLIMAPAAALAGGPVQPTARWVVNFDAAQCVASRNYGTAKDPVFLVLKAPPLGDIMQMAVMRHGNLSEARQLDATLTFDDSRPLATTVLSYKAPGGSLRAHVTNLAARDFAALRQARSLAIRSTGLNEKFALSAMETLLTTMQECVVDLRHVWNVTDPSGTESKLKQRATANLASYFSNDDYPVVALDAGQSGVVSFALLVDEAGKVADCTVISTSGAASLDAQTCGLLKKRAKLSPALGADGKPAKDALIGRVRWLTSAGLSRCLKLPPPANAGRWVPSCGSRSAARG